MMKIIKGIPASGGIAAGPAYIFKPTEIGVKRETIQNPAAELSRLESARNVAREQLKALKLKTENEASADEAAIFDAHAMFLDDPSLLELVADTVNAEKVNVEAAWADGIENFARQMEMMGDEYLSARAADIRDVGKRVLRILSGQSETDLSGLNAPSVILAQDLTPSDTARLNKDFVLGFATAEGGPTSHTAILAKALGLPAVVGCGPALMEIKSGSEMLIHGGKGELIADPDEKTKQLYQKLTGEATRVAGVELEAAAEHAVTRDGRQVEIVANVGSPSDAVSALKYGAEGIGLLRTEFLYLERTTAPTEEEQLAAYNAVLDVMEKRPVVVRTLDVGGDKQLDYLDLGKEANPFLGWRAIRMCLDKPDFFKIQLRALLRASPNHDLRIMFPMIATLEEVRRSKALLAEARKEVLAAGHPVADNIQVGIMVEIPAAAQMADFFAREVDFFSIGTNDLTQYTMAAERTSEKMAYLADPCHPAVIRQIKRVIEEGHKQGIWVGVCGEMAGDPEAAPILLGLGLDEFSMAAPGIPHLKAILREWSYADAQKLAEHVLNLENGTAVREYVRGFTHA
ncbi:MAG: phosphoenolpyruvate--protein phosphotransferase [Chloroflexi bacterium]|jgi:phosphotransferase system enzyme I (PtsI)|nr:phosphoenolpyruvate--protein phosphotransferase [Chloroflexota bacterium]HOE35552.1 phosphoenolpyruvate--protein phosphotransferase [Anaerolineaceae bacterium]